MEHTFDFEGAARREREQAGPQVWSVAELTERVKGLLGGLGRVSVEGEVASLRRPASGHVYFNLKDRLKGVESVVNCAVWASRARQVLRDSLEEGAKVIAHGRLDVYAPRGTYSLIVERVEARGIGRLLAELEELKKELQARGWFERARPIPAMPRTIGVATSRDGAAFQDFLRTRSLRWPLYPVRLCHTPVQGPGAAREIAAAIRALDASGVDVIVVCRGGGSLEDLWAFNELPVAEAIWEARAPVVSGVGHETDVTLADFVADLRAHTPTDAAQRVIPDRRERTERLERTFNYLLDAVDRQLEGREERLRRAGRARVLGDPEWILGERFAALERLARRLGLALERRAERSGARLRELAAGLVANGPVRRVERAGERLTDLGRRLVQPVQDALRRREARLEVLARGLEATSPFAVLKRGYSITRRADDGRPITRAAELAPGARIETLLAEGSLLSSVEEARPEREGGEEA